MSNKEIKIPIYFSTRLSHYSNLPYDVRAALPLGVNALMTADFVNASITEDTRRVGIAVEALTNLFAGSPVMQLLNRIDEAETNLLEPNFGNKEIVQESGRRIMEFVTSLQYKIFNDFINTATIKPAQVSEFMDYLSGKAGRALLKKVIVEALKGDDPRYGVALTDYRMKGALFDDVNRHWGLLDKGVTIHQMMMDKKWRKDPISRDYGIRVPIAGIEDLEARVSCYFADEDADREAANNPSGLKSQSVFTRLYLGRNTLYKIASGIPTFYQ